MRRIINITLISLLLGLTFLSCKSSNGHCDAYGNKSGSVKH